MPNHVHNIVTIECNEERLEEIYTKVMYDESESGRELTGKGSIDFNKVIPMPKELLITCGTETDRGIEMFLHVSNPETKNYGHKKLTKDAFKELVAGLNSEKMVYKYKEMLSEEEIALYTKDTDILLLLERGKTAVANYIQYGATTWYDWSINNWDTKWNGYDEELRDGGFEFNTAWSAPHNIIATISKRFPDVTITHYWADEDLGNNCGKRIYREGVLEKEFFPKRKDSESFAKLIWAGEEVR